MSLHKKGNVFSSNTLLEGLLSRLQDEWLHEPVQEQQNDTLLARFFLEENSAGNNLTFLFFTSVKNSE